MAMKIFVNSAHTAIVTLGAINSPITFSFVCQHVVSAVDHNYAKGEMSGCAERARVNGNNSER